jgi:phasin family protein
MFPADQFAAVTKSNIEAQLAALTALTSAAFDGVEKVLELNITTAKTSLEESGLTAKQLLAAKDPQEFISLSAAQAQPTAAKAIAYSRHLAGIASSTQAELARTAEEQLSATGRRISELVDDVSRNAPPGAENLFGLFKTAIGNASAGYEQFSRNTKQAAEAMEANMNAAAKQFTQATEKAAGAARARK